MNFKLKNNIKQIISYIKENIYTIESIESLSTHFGYSRFHFSREFKKLTGFSINEFISSIKMENSIENLVNKNKSVLYSHLNAGFLSSTTFSSSFEKQTGIKPKQYQKQLNELYNAMKEYENKKSSIESHYEKSDFEKNKYKCIVILNYPHNYNRGISFVGLFNIPIPNHKPIVGKAIVGSTICVLDNIPKGKFYLLACSIEKNSSLSNYFVLKNCLRSKIDYALEFPKNNLEVFHLNFREPLPYDPPININLPKLLYDGLKNKTAN